MSNIILVLYVLTTSLGLVVLKLGTSAGVPMGYMSDKFHISLNPLTFLGIFIYGISFILYMYLISKFDLGYIIPLTAAFVYILIFVASFFIFKEAFTVAKVVGIALIIGGLIFLQAGK